jgi:hypothetical protein
MMRVWFMRLVRCDTSSGTPLAEAKFIVVHMFYFVKEFL